MPEQRRDVCVGKPLGKSFRGERMSIMLRARADAEAFLKPVEPQTPELRTEWIAAVVAEDMAAVRVFFALFGNDRQSVRIEVDHPRLASVFHGFMFVAVS